LRHREIGRPVPLPGHFLDPLGELPAVRRAAVAVVVPEADERDLEALGGLAPHRVEQHGPPPCLVPVDAQLVVGDEVLVGREVGHHLGQPLGHLVGAAAHPAGLGVVDDGVRREQALVQRPVLPVHRHAVLDGQVLQLQPVRDLLQRQCHRGPSLTRSGSYRAYHHRSVVTGLMPAAVYEGGGRLAVRELPVPAVGPDEVLVEVSHCGVCGTDLHLVLEDRARPGSVLGHEWAGTVAACGAQVSGWAIGAPVVATPEPTCGTCRACRRGRPSVCLRREPPDYLAFRGAFTRYVTVAAARLARLPAGLSTRVAALTEPTAIALHGVALAAPEPGDRILVNGAGPVGLLVTAVLRAKGFEDVTVVEPSEVRRAQARAVGAAAAIAPTELAVPAMG